jgi:hypothetical protein
MLKGICLSKSRILAFLTLFALGNQANAHGVVTPFPIGHHIALSTHAAITGHALNALLLKPSAHSVLALNSTRIPGFSGSQSIFKGELKTYTGQGVIQGIIKQFNSGNISGQFVGTGYETDFGSPSVGGNIILTFGPNNPAFTNPPATISSPGLTAITFSPAGSAKSGLLGITPLHLSGSQRIIQNQLNGIILNGVKVGRTVAQTGLTGGYFSGTYYGNLGTAPTFRAGGTFGTAFGNSPLNVHIPAGSELISGLPNQPSYLNFLNKINIPISSAQVYSQAYATVGGPFHLSPGSPFIFTAGSNPLNVPSASTFFTRTILAQTSFIHLKFKFF